jgi:hypothetical protein
MKIFICFIFLFFCASLGYAHPPAKIDIKYDAKTKMITADIIHIVMRSKSHYIIKVDIGLNGKEIKELKFKKQETYKKQSISYKIIADIKKGDKISVEAYCSLSGKLQKEIVV